MHWYGNWRNRITQMYAAPGNPGIVPYAERVPFSVSQISEMADFAERHQIDLTMVGARSASDQWYWQCLPTAGSAHFWT